MRNHVIMIAGLGSSICPWRYSAWARQLKKTLLSNEKIPHKNTTIHIVSSDGDGEKSARDAVLADHKKGKLGKVIVGGHSNGARDALLMCEAFYGRDIDVPYAFVIDMTLGEFGAEAYGNIAVLDEFWAGLQTADFHSSFKGKHKFHDLDKMAEKNVGHVEAASHPITQQRIAGMIEVELSK